MGPSSKNQGWGGNSLFSSFFPLHIRPSSLFLQFIFLLSPQPSYLSSHLSSYTATPFLHISPYSLSFLVSFLLYTSSLLFIIVSFPLRLSFPFTILYYFFPNQNCIFFLPLLFLPVSFFCMTLHSSFSNENFLCCLSMICLFLFCLFDFVFFPPLLYLCLSFDWVILHSPSTRQSTPFIPLLSLLPRLPLSIFLSLPCVIFH